MHNPMEPTFEFTSSAEDAIGGVKNAETEEPEPVRIRSGREVRPHHDPEKRKRF